jgi:hypothetical protein
VCGGSQVRVLGAPIFLQARSEGEACRKGNGKMLMRICSDAARLAKAFLARGEWGREACWAAERAILISWHRLGVEVVLIEHALILFSPEICRALFRGRGEQIDCVAQTRSLPA